jgi:hypothetical protein
MTFIWVLIGIWVSDARPVYLEAFSTQAQCEAARNEFAFDLTDATERPREIFRCDRLTKEETPKPIGVSHE